MQIKKTIIFVSTMLLVVTASSDDSYNTVSEGTYGTYSEASAWSYDDSADYNYEKSYYDYSSTS